MSVSIKSLRLRDFKIEVKNIVMKGTPTMSGTSSIEVPGWYINFQAAVIKQLPRPGEIEQDIAEGWEGNQASLKRVLGKCLLPPISKTTIEPTTAEKKIFAEWRAKWPEFWSMFGINVGQIMGHQNFPKQPLPGFPWVIVDPGVMDDKKLAETLFKKVDILYWVSVALLDYTNSAEPKQVSVILVRDTIEPDKEYLGKSADDADKITAEKGTRFILRRHWIILFAFLWWLTKGKQKLDASGWTRFPKNRLSDGNAANGYWYPYGGKVKLNYNNGDYRNDSAGPREGNFFSL